MKLEPDIRSKLEEDIKRLTEAFLTGEISLPDPSNQSSPSYESQIYALSSNIFYYQLENRLLSSILPYLFTMKWLTLSEACIYSRHSRNTLLSWLECGKIYGTKPEGSGNYIIDRESIDKYFNTLKNEREIQLSKLRRVR